MTGLRLFGWDQSTYTRSVLLALLEKGLTAELVTTNPFAEGAPTAEHLDRQPFGKIPALEHGGFRLYETVAILRYLDEACPGPALQPADPQDRARMQQILSILDSYAYRALVWDLFVNSREETLDEAALARGVEIGGKALTAIADLMKGPWLCGDQLTLADCHLAPILRYAVDTQEGRELLSGQPNLVAWWQAAEARRGWGEILGAAA
ncbi:MAG: glutathione S-transferase family protein [Pseudomonadota bacterium]